MNKFGKTIGALAVVQAFTIATSASAQTVQITSGSMAVSQALLEEEGSAGVWMLAGQDLSANGFFDIGGQFPANYLTVSPVQLGMSLGMSWVSDSEDGWDGQMVFKGVTYNLGSSPDSLLSFMSLNASPIVLGQATSYQEPFTFSTQFCGSLAAPMFTCDASVGLVGSGTLHLVVSPLTNFPGSVNIQSLSYQFAGVPEPNSLALLLTGVFALGLTWSQSHRYRHVRAFA